MTPARKCEKCGGPLHPHAKATTKICPACNRLRSRESQDGFWRGWIAGCRQHKKGRG